LLKNWWETPMHACRERPRSRRTPEHRDELAPSHHSITSSARASNVPRHFEAGCVRILVRCGWSRYFFAVIIL
jgi:hypothetical protein